MEQAKKFLFEVNFEDPLNDVHEEPLATFTEEELAAARQEGVDEGKAAGRKEAEAETERLAANVLKKISEHIATLDAAQSEASKSNAHDASQLAMTVAQKVIPEISKHGALIEIEAMVHKCLADRFDEPRVVVRVHDSLLDNLRAQIDSVAASAGFAGKLILLADDSLQIADCRVEWADGGADRDEERLWKEIEETVCRLTDQLRKDGAFPARSPAASTEEHEAAIAIAESKSTQAAEESEEPAETEATDAPEVTASETPVEPLESEAPAAAAETEDSAEMEGEEPEAAPESEPAEEPAETENPAEIEASESPGENDER